MNLYNILKNNENVEIKYDFGYFTTSTKYK